MSRLLLEELVEQVGVLLMVGTGSRNRDIVKEYSEYST